MRVTIGFLLVSVVLLGFAIGVLYDRIKHLESHIEILEK